MSESNTLRRFIVVLFWLTLALASAPAGAQDEPAAAEDASAAQAKQAWDQEQVTTLAKELESAVRGVRRAFRGEPIPSVASGEARSRHQLLDLLRLVESESRHLARQLEAGEDREATSPVFERLLEIIRNAQDLRARIFVQAQALERIDNANALLREISGYYGVAMPEPRKVIR